MPDAELLQLWPDFALFENLSCTVTGPGFVRAIHHQCYQNSVHLLGCAFEPGHYSDACFSRYGIRMPAELQQAVPKRKAEFLAGRIAAKYALQALGFAAEQLQVAVSEDRAPRWPEQVSASISHNAQLAFCCVAAKSQWSRIGIDCETLLSPSAAQQIALEIHNQTELELLLQAGFTAPVATTVIFSAKESLYKALYPEVGQFFGFDTARLCRLNTKSQLLYLRLNGDFAAGYALTTEYEIQYCIKNNRVYTLLMQ